MLKSLLRDSSLAEPLKLPVYRASWSASLVSNMGIQILGVGAGWAMTQMTDAPDRIALVQTALMLPITLFALPAGAIADMYDRRIVAFTSLSISGIASAMLAVCIFMNALTPAILFAFCLVIAAGQALFNPAWQASVNDQVPYQSLPAAVSLNSISFNFARSFGPAIGGLLVAAAGTAAAFVATAIGYIPMLAALYKWERNTSASPLPPEGLKRAVISGVRYVMHAPQIRVVLLRSFVGSTATASIAALMPVIVHTQLQGDARIFGIMLGCFGVGAVVSSILVPRVRRSVDHELAVRTCLTLHAVCCVAIALSHTPAITGIAMVGAGAGWMMASVLFNVGVQLAAPRWVSARVLATFQAVLTLGMAGGGWMWGLVAKAYNTETAMLLSGAAVLASAALGFVIRMPNVEGSHRDSVTNIADPEIALAINGNSGPVVVEIEYRVRTADARDFYNTMLEMQLSRQRNGAYGWAIARDVGNAEIWTERLHYPSWHDYLRQRHRATLAEQDLHARAVAFHQGPEPVQVRRMLDRPYSSDSAAADVPAITA